MADESFKPIIAIKENGEVQSFDFKTNKLANNKVTRLFRFDADSHLLINNNLKVTEKHPFAGLQMNSVSQGISPLHSKQPSVFSIHS